MKNEMIDFLERLPWASQALLDGYFGPEKAEELLQQCSDEIESFRFPYEQLHYTVKPADYHLLPGIYRREMVRNYMAEKYGYSIFDTAESPSFNADFRTFYEEQNLWIRVWGDMGHISVESLLIFRNPPAFASDVHDIILTCQGWERTAFIKIQAELNWNDAKNGNVEIIDYVSGHRVICTGFKSEENHKPYDPEKDSCQSLSPSEISVYNDTGKREISIQKLRSTDICLKSAMLSQGDYDLLRFIACNPFLKRPEIQLLFGSDDCDADSYELTEAEHDRIKMLQGDIDRLKDNGFLRIIPSGPMDDTYLLTWKGLDLVAAYHATIPFYLKKYSQWPQESFMQKDFDLFRDTLDDNYSFFDSHCFYKQRWGTIRPEHQILCKEFASALILGARSMKSEFGCDYSVSGMTTISSNLKLTALSHGRKMIRMLHPDGACTFEYTSPLCSQKWKIFIEIERNRNRESDLAEKLEKYRRFIPAAKQFYKGYDDILLMFFFDDTTGRTSDLKDKTKFLLETMRKYGITGCVGLLSDAKKIPDGWLPKHGNIEMETCGGLMLYQNIWRTTEILPENMKLNFPGFLFS